MTEELPRRTVLRTAGLLGLAAGVGTAVSGAGPSSDRSEEAAPRTVEIPVGGGKVFAKENLVITQPAPGEFRGFEAACTHSGCTVGAVVDGAIHCYCHGSRFRIADGSVQTGPALLPLPPVPVVVEKGRVRRAR
ncbi:MAG: Rieske (2Fe-2S) protein [Sporichthyaceae bacterium]